MYMVGAGEIRNRTMGYGGVRKLKEGGRGWSEIFSRAPHTHLNGTALSSKLSELTLMLPLLKEYS